MTMRSFIFVIISMAYLFLLMMNVTQYYIDTLDKHWYHIYKKECHLIPFTAYVRSLSCMCCNNLSIQAIYSNLDCIIELPVLENIGKDTKIIFLSDPVIEIELNYQFGSHFGQHPKLKGNKALYIICDGRNEFLDPQNLVLDTSFTILSALVTAILDIHGF